MREELAAMLALAEEKLRAARLLLEGEAWGDASSRAYYAAFHAVSAALLSQDETYSSHAQVRVRDSGHSISSMSASLSSTRICLTATYHTPLYVRGQSKDIHHTAVSGGVVTPTLSPLGLQRLSSTGSKISRTSVPQLFGQCLSNRLSISVCIGSPSA